MLNKSLECFCYYADTWVLSMFEFIVDTEGDREWGVKEVSWWGHDEDKHVFFFNKQRRFMIYFFIQNYMRVARRYCFSLLRSCLTIKAP